MSDNQTMIFWEAAWEKFGDLLDDIAQDAEVDNKTALLNLLGYDQEFGVDVAIALLDKAGRHDLAEMIQEATKASKINMRGEIS